MAMNAIYLTQWWNLIFEIPLAIALMYLGVYTLSGWTFGEADLDHDFDIDHDVDLDHDVDVDHDVDLDHDVDVDHDVDADADADHDADTDHDAESGRDLPVWLTIVAWLGVGRIPLSLVLMVLGLTWGIIGFGANHLFVGASAPWRLSLPLAALGSIFAAHLVSAFIHRYLPLNETYAAPRHALLGATGHALYAIDESFGMARVRDPRGNLFQIPCRVANGHPPIAKDAQVYLAGYSEKDNMFYVKPN
jgi:hypothetical protein